MRSDARRNRERLLQAAETMFRERGIDVSVGDIADAAGVGRGTLFRNFASKDALIAAVVADRISELLDYGRGLLEGDGDDAEVMFTFLSGLAERQERNRALLQAVSDDLVASVPELRAAHAALLELLGALLARGKRAGSVRPEAGAADVLFLVKSLCTVTPAGAPVPGQTAIRHLDLVRAALSTPEYSRPLRGEPAPLRP
ncbi:MAG: helix-turn-helix domain containing protein [Actinomycetota bacterium]|nr:helix-turn-helix domain containing protein [Actinomycetota bacterium]